MEINIYWNDLSKEGKEMLMDSGFQPSEEHLQEDKPVGEISIND